MSFENKANRAANSIHRSVATVRPAGVGVITRRHRLGLATAVAFFGILAGASVAFAAMLPGQADEKVTATETTAVEVTSTIPTEPGPPIVVVPADGEGTDGEGTDGETVAIPGTEFLVLANDDPSSLTGTRWDNWTFGFEVTTTTEPEEETTTTTKPVSTSITAHQYYGPASSNPYEKIYGTAPPGTKVLLTSAYGSSDMTVGSSGEYYLKVYFSGQPSNEYFPITAKVGSKTYTFQFKWTGSYEITAMQYYGPENTERKDKVYGTAPPGTRVFATSDYGSSDLTVDSSGQYWLHIYFDETLPADQWITWTATLKDPSGTVLKTKTFDFKWVTTPVDVTASQYYGPENNERKDKVYGTAPPGTRVFATSDYGSYDMTVDSSGSYKLYIYFDETLPAEQQIQWHATLKDPSGTVLLTKTFNFTYLPTPIDVTASQYYGPEHDQRYDKVYGTAPEGTIVTTSSAYGSSDTVVGASGDYYLKIHFDETLPAEQWIEWTATLKDPSDNVLLTKTFDFKYTPTYDPTANQKWGPESSDPQEKIYGTAPPGSAVSAVSPFGSASMTVGSSGSYALVVSFTSPTPNEAFAISVIIKDESENVLLDTTFFFTHVVT